MAMHSATTSWHASIGCMSQAPCQSRWECGTAAATSAKPVPLQSAAHTRLRPITQQPPVRRPFGRTTLRLTVATASGGSGGTAAAEDLPNITAVRSMTKPQLQDALTLRGLATSGTKPALVDRLWAALSADAMEAGSIWAEADGTPEADSKETNADADDAADAQQMSLTQLQQLKKGDLQELLVQRGLPKTGNKGDLAERVRWAGDEDGNNATADPSLPTAMAAAPAVPPTGRSSVIAPDDSVDDLETVQDEGDVGDLLDPEYEDDAVEDQFENSFGDMPGAAQVMQDIAARGRGRTSVEGNERGQDWLDEPEAVEADEPDSSWMRPGRRDETAAERFARYTEGFSVEDEDAPPLPLEEDDDELAAAEAVAAADAADLPPSAPGDGSAADRDLERLGEFADDDTAAAAAEESYQIDLGIDEEELARLEQEYGSADVDDFGSGIGATAEQDHAAADVDDFGSGGFGAAEGDLVNTGSELPGAGAAELEDQGAMTDAAADPLAPGRDDDDAPFAPAFEPDDMAQLASVDADADYNSSGAPAAQTVDALSDTDPADGLTQAAAGLGATPAQMAAVLDDQADSFGAEVDSAFAADEAEPDEDAAEAIAAAETVQSDLSATRADLAAAITAAKSAQLDMSAEDTDAAAAAAAAAADKVGFGGDAAEGVWRFAPGDAMRTASRKADSAERSRMAAEADAAAAAYAAGPADADISAALDPVAPATADVTPADITAELAQQSANADPAAAAFDAEPAVPPAEPGAAAAPAPQDATPADITAELAQQSVEPPPGPLAEPYLNFYTLGDSSEGAGAEGALPVAALEGGPASEAPAPPAEADEAANLLMASTAAGVPGVLDADVTAETAGEVMRGVLAAEAAQLEDLARKAAGKEAALAIMRDTVQRSEATGAANAGALAELSDQVAELRSAQLDWQQNVLAGRLKALKEDSERIAANDRLKEELGATLDELEGKMEKLDADLAARNREADQLQESLTAATGAEAPPKPAYNGTAVKGTLGDGSQSGSSGKGGMAAAAAGLPIDDGRLRGRVEAAAAAEVPAAERPKGSKGLTFGVAVAAGLMGAFGLGRGLVGSLLRLQPRGQRDDDGSAAAGTQDAAAGQDDERPQPRQQSDDGGAAARTEGKNAAADQDDEPDHKLDHF